MIKSRRPFRPASALFGGLAALDRNHLAANTPVVSLLDNGEDKRHGNSPLRGHKHERYECGILVPFALRKPGEIPADSTYTQPVIARDLFATCSAFPGPTSPTSHPIDGVNPLPFLTGRTTELPRSTIYWTNGANRAVRGGDLKLVAERGHEDKSELFDLAQDVAEKKNLAPARPAEVARLKNSSRHGRQITLRRCWAATRALTTPKIDSVSSKF